MSIQQTITDYGKPFILLSATQPLNIAFNALVSQNLPVAESFVVVSDSTGDYRVASFATLEYYLEETGYDALIGPAGNIPYKPDFVLNLNDDDDNHREIDQLTDVPNTVLLVVEGTRIVAVLYNPSLAGFADTLGLISLVLDHIRAKDHPALDRQKFDKARTVLDPHSCGFRGVVTYNIEKHRIECPKCHKEVIL
jgi:hypothetical protein